MTGQAVGNQQSDVSQAEAPADRRNDRDSSGTPSGLVAVKKVRGPVEGWQRLIGAVRTGQTYMVAPEIAEKLIAGGEFESAEK